MPDEFIQIERMMEVLDSPEWQAKHEKDQQFLRDFVYSGFTDINTGFDSPRICHFSQKISFRSSIAVNPLGSGSLESRYLQQT